MVVTLVWWLYITLICLAAGDVVWTLLSRFIPSAEPLPVPAIVLIGWAGLTNILGYVWLFVPVGLGIHLVLLVGAIGWLARRYGYWRTQVSGKFSSSVNFWFAFGLGCIVILTRTTQLPRLADTGGYHAPMIRWITEYAVIPGLANVNYRFGFNNASFLTEAFFSLRFLNGTSVHVLNGWLMLVFFSWALLLIAKSKKSISDWMIIGSGVLFLWHAHWRLSSPTPDHPAQLMIAFLFYLLIRQIENPNRLTEQFLIVWLTLLAFTIKMSTLVALLIPVFLLITTIRNGHTRLIPGMILMGALPLGWWLGANVILTGYILYPTTSPLLDWFSVDWKVPKEIIEQGLINLSGGTKLSPVSGLFDFSWVFHWFLLQLFPDQILLILVFGWPVFALFFPKKTPVSHHPTLRWILLIAYAGVAFWFINAPEFRFGIGFIIAAVTIGYASFRNQLNSVYLYLGISFLGSVLLFASVKRQSPPLLSPLPYPQAQVRSYTLHGQPVYVAEDDQRVIHGIKGYWSNCYDTALPCCPYYNPRLQLRGKTLEDGFRME